MPTLDPSFNKVVRRFSVPVKVSKEQFPDFEAMRESFLSTGRLSISPEFCEHTIFGNMTDNIRFRAWHDSIHLLLGEDFSAEGEAKVAEYQIQQVFDAYGVTEQSKRWAALINCEINVQAAHFFKTGSFVEDQYQFTINHLKSIGLELSN